MLKNVLKLSQVRISTRFQDLSDEQKILDLFIYLEFLKSWA